MTSCLSASSSFEVSCRLHATLQSTESESRRMEQTTTRYVSQTQSEQSREPRQPISKRSWDTGGGRYIIECLHWAQGPTRAIRCLICPECESSESKQPAFVTRDMNSALNIRQLALTWMTEKTRPVAFCRETNVTGLTRTFIQFISLQVFCPCMFTCAEPKRLHTRRSRL